MSNNETDIAVAAAAPAMLYVGISKILRNISTNKTITVFLRTACGLFMVKCAPLPVLLSNTAVKSISR